MGWGVPIYRYRLGWGRTDLRLGLGRGLSRVGWGWVEVYTRVG
jgi:hypothetical protein